MKEYREVNRIRSGFERTLTFRLIKLFSDIGNDTADAFVETGTQGASAVLDRIRPRLESTLIPVYREIIKTFTDRAIGNRPSAKRAIGFEEIYGRFMREMGAAHISDIDDTTRRQVRAIISFHQTEGVPAIADAIRTWALPKSTRARAHTIARTETHSAASFATHGTGNKL